MTGIYDKDRMKCRTNIQQLNTLFDMGKELESKVDEKSYDGITITPTDYGINIDYDNTGDITITNMETYYLIAY